MQRDFPVATTPRHRVYFMARAIRLLRDPGAYSSMLINASGERVYRIVWNHDSFGEVGTKALAA